MSTAPQPKGPLLGVLALVLGAIGAVVTFLPVNLDDVRPYAAWAFGLPGIVVAVFGLLGNRQGKPMAGVGAMLSVLALIVGALVLGNLAGRA